MAFGAVDSSKFLLKLLDDDLTLHLIQVDVTLEKLLVDFSFVIDLVNVVSLRIQVIKHHCRHLLKKFSINISSYKNMISMGGQISLIKMIWSFSVGTMSFLIKRVAKKSSN
ncbi:unnamed protein product [Haemonchus placei]|uniref:Uncharacterized protein n=1 Tax=Haemonchus placei TaxID=6290 RepID=A0A3P7Z7V7_HAEPC|nr:unnamed protein product [Haemonchus placei]